jgi:rhodanese-related sulfurtransferase
MQILESEDLRKAQQTEQPFVLVNVLPAAKFAETEIPGAISIPLEDPDFAARVAEVAGGKNHSVITYCASEECPASTDAARKLEEAGFTDVFDYKAGAKGWRESQRSSHEEQGMDAPGQEHPTFASR